MISAIRGRSIGASNQNVNQLVVELHRNDLHGPNVGAHGDTATASYDTAPCTKVLLTSVALCLLGANVQRTLLATSGSVGRSHSRLRGFSTQVHDLPSDAAAGRRRRLVRGRTRWWAFRASCRCCCRFPSRWSLLLMLMFVFCLFVCFMFGIVCCCFCFMLFDALSGPMFHSALVCLLLFRTRFECV